MSSQSRRTEPGGCGGITATTARAVLLTLGCAITSFGYPADVVKYNDLQSIRELDAVASAGKRVDFEATVTYVCGMREFLFVQDGPHAIFVFQPDATDVSPGQRVRIQGRLAKGDLLPIVADPIVTKVRDGRLPPAEKVSVIGVEHDCRYLEFEFAILQTSVGPSETMLHAKTESNVDVSIQVPHAAGIALPDISCIAGGRVRISGVLGLQLEGGGFIEPGKQHNRIVGYKIFCNSPDDIVIVDADPSSMSTPANPVGLSYLTRDALPDGRFATFAQICLIDDDEPRALVVRDGSTFMRFQLHSTLNLQPGMMIRIGGTKSTNQNGDSEFVVDHLCQQAMAEFPEPETMTVDGAVRSFSSNRRIAVEGTPLRVENRDGNRHLILGDGKSTIAVEFQELAMDTFAAVDPGIARKVRITGVTQSDEKHDFKLVVVRANDAVLLEKKTSTSRIIAIGVTILFIVCALAALWIKLLRARVSQKQRFEAIFDNAGCPIIVFNGNLQMIDANQLAADLTEYSKDELRSMRVMDIDSTLPVENIQRMLAETMSSQEVAVFRTQIQTKSGCSKDVEVHSRNLAVSEDPVKATFIAVFPDTTARNQYEKQLKDARDEAIKANKAKSRFLASMSHELRTPLNGVIGMTQLLEATELTPVQADYLAACRTSGETLLTVIGDVLDFSKMEAGKLKLDPQETELIPFVENIVQATSLQQKTRHIDLASFVDPRLSRSVLVDSDRFRQVIFNLIGNAAKFTPRGSITVTAKCSEVNRQYADIRFVVADTGIGIPQDQVDRLFEPFEQRDSSTTREYGGTGLGLSICKQIVDLMDGRIHAESVEGEGSRFIVDVRLPFATSETEEAIDKQDNQTTHTYPRVAVVGMSDPISRLLAQMFSAYQVDALFFKEDEVLPQGEIDVVLLNNDGNPETMRRALECQIALLSNNAPAVIPVIPPSCVSEPEAWTQFGVQKPVHSPFSQTRLLQAIDLRPASGEDSATNHALSTINRRSNQSLRVLICEDVPVNRMFVKEICRKAGISCVVSDNGRIGIETLQRDADFDVIFMDCHMPVMDGFEATKRIRKMTDNGLIPRIPIVALTANAVAGDRQKCLDAGMDDYLAKPFEVEQFLEKTYSNAAQSPRNHRDNSEPLSTVFDIDGLTRQFADRDFAIQMAKAFAHSLKVQRADLQSCLANVDVGKAINIAHRLKGSAGTMKAERIANLAIEMESTARDGKVDKLQTQVAAMLQEFERFINAVEEESPAYSI